MPRRDVSGWSGGAGGVTALTCVSIRMLTATCVVAAVVAAEVAALGLTPTPLVLALHVVLPFRRCVEDMVDPIRTTRNPSSAWFGRAVETIGSAALFTARRPRATRRAPLDPPPTDPDEEPSAVSGGDVPVARTVPVHAFARGIREERP
jgi:hypothetical protein